MIASLDRPTSSGTHDLSPGGPVNGIAAIALCAARNRALRRRGESRSAPPGRAAGEIGLPPRWRCASVAAGGAAYGPALVGTGRGAAVRRGYGEAVAHAGP